MRARSKNIKSLRVKDYVSKQPIALKLELNPISQEAKRIPKIVFGYGLLGIVPIVFLVISIIEEFTETKIAVLVLLLVPALKWHLEKTNVIKPLRLANPLNAHDTVQSKIVISYQPEKNIVKENIRMPKNFTYTNAGVNRDQRHESKKHLKTLEETYKHSQYGGVMRLPYGNIFPLSQNNYLDLVIEGVGTKVLVAQLADTYDTIGVDAVAMAVNDIIRSGAKPLAIADNIHAQASDPKLVKAWLEGVAKGAAESECPVTGGEIGDVAEIIKGIAKGVGFDMIVAAVGQVAKQDIITGENIKPEDPIIGLRSSGLHSNGITLARKILFSQWGGKHKPNDVPAGLDREIAHEVLEPTKIYVKSLLETAQTVKVKAAVHITGDAYLKFNNLTHFSPGIGFEFSNFKPQPIFGLIQKTALKLDYTITDEEMFRTFNMGWGFAIIVNKKDKDRAVSALEKAGAQPEQIGKVTAKHKIVIHHENKKLVLA